MSWGPGFWAGRWPFGAFGDVPGCRCVPKEAPPRGQQGGEWDGGGRAGRQLPHPSCCPGPERCHGAPRAPTSPSPAALLRTEKPPKAVFHSISLCTTAANRLNVGQAAAFQQHPLPRAFQPGPGGAALLPRSVGVPSCLSFPFPADFPLSCRPGGGLIIIDSMPDIRKRKPIPLVSDLGGGGKVSALH